MNIPGTSFPREGSAGRGLRHRRGERGAGLIEILVALLILSSVAVAFSRSTLSSRRAGDASRFETEATMLAMDQIERLRILQPAAPELADGLHVDSGAPQFPNGGIYTRSWRITSNTPDSGMKTVEMYVAWPSQLGGRSIRLVTALGVL